MCVICFEGPSAVGKTATARAFGETNNVYVVQEADELFVRPKYTSMDWYLARQIERWSIAEEQHKAHRFVILDGDPFQPFWYNWTFSYEGLQTLNFLEQFYWPRVVNGVITFPDLYIVFGAGEDELRKRRRSDRSRERKGFEKHLSLIRPQQRYFRAMASFSPGRVSFLETVSVQKNLNFVQKSLSTIAKYLEDDAAKLFSTMVSWLKST